MSSIGFSVCRSYPVLSVRLPSRPCRSGCLRRRGCVPRRVALEERVVRFQDSLPPPPEAATVANVLPYLLRVAFTRQTNYWRVLAAVLFVFVSKAGGLAAPYFLKVAVEKLSERSLLVAQCLMNIFFFGACKVISSLAQEMEYPVFAPVAQVSLTFRQRLIDLENRKSGKAVDVLQNLETVRIFNNQYLEVHQFHELLKEYQEASLSYEQVMALLNSGQTFIVTVGLTLSLAVTILAGGRSMTAGDLVLMQGMIMQVWTPLSYFGWFYRETRQCLTDMQEYLNILKTESTIKDGSLDFNCVRKKANGAKEHHGVKLSFKNISFGYTPDRTVLKGVDLEVPAGSSVALVGESGSGKSTLVSLLVRLYDVDEGSIRYDGIDIRELTAASLRSVVGVVPQDTVLFNDTLYNNILYGHPEASEEEVRAAAKMAQLDSAVRRMPGGYGTIVGERGLKLSGGEKQRVAIARTFLRSPKLLVCDEATSALDTATEQEIMASLTQLAKGRTSVFVAHRLSTIQECDKIVVMSDGKVIEQGTHEELMQRERAYYAMWQAQARKDAVEECRC